MMKKDFDDIIFSEKMVKCYVDDFIFYRNINICMLYMYSKAKCMVRVIDYSWMIGFKIFLFISIFNLFITIVYYLCGIVKV